MRLEERKACQCNATVWTSVVLAHRLDCIASYLAFIALRAGHMLRSPRYSGAVTMYRKFRVATVVAVLSLLIVQERLAVSSAVAQSSPSPQRSGAPAPPPAVAPLANPSGPDQTTATFADWILRCIGALQQRVCEIVQTVNVDILNAQGQSQRQPVLQVALGRVGPGAPLRLMVVLPNNVDLLAPVKLEGDPGQTLVILPWQRCLPVGCFAGLDVNETVLSQLRTRADAGRVALKDGSARETVIAVSFRGFTQALEALARER